MFSVKYSILSLCSSDKSIWELALEERDQAEAEAAKQGIGIKYGKVD